MTELSLSNLPKFENLLFYDDNYTCNIITAIHAKLGKAFAMDKYLEEVGAFLYARVGSGAWVWGLGCGIRGLGAWGVACVVWGVGHLVWGVGVGLGSWGVGCGGVSWGVWCVRCSMRVPPFGTSMDMHTLHTPDGRWM